MSLSSPVPTKMDDLCHLCKEINLWNLRAYFHPKYDGNFGPMERPRESLSDDCPLCRLFQSVITQWLPRDVLKVTIKAEFTRPDDARVLPAIWSSLTTSVRERLAKLGRIEYCPLSRIAVTPYCAKDSQSTDDYDSDDFEDLPSTYLNVLIDPTASTVNERQYVCGRVIYPPGSSINVANMQNWLKECMTQHPLCHIGISGQQYPKNPDESALPKRVISVGLANGASGLPNGEPFVFESNGQRGRYAALSYSWESDPQVMLKQKNKADFKVHLPILQLSKTIQDAIDITRRLGIPYIWIDRLCIVQDDTDDWDTEAQKMCDIYEGACVTFAGLGAIAREEGLYLPRDKDPLVRMPLATRDKAIGQMYITPEWMPSGSVEKLGPSLEMEFQMSRWNTRGWVLQERFLSRRIIYFGRRQIYWECQETTRKEDGTHDGSETMYAGTARGKGDFLKDLRMYGFASHIRSALPAKWSDKLIGPTFWTDIVKDYSMRQLTVDKDKVQAIAGVAQAMKRRLSLGDYAFGIFSENIDQQLLWYSKGDLSPSKFQRAPSWSWMRYNGRIRTLKDRCSVMIRDCSFVPPPAVFTDFPPEEAVPGALAMRITGDYVPGVCRPRIPSTANEIRDWMMYAQQCFNYDFDAANYMSLPKLFQFDFDESNVISDAIPKLFQKPCEKSCQILSINDKICGVVKFDLHDHTPSNICCLIVAEDSDADERHKGVNEGKEIRRRRIYHLLALEDVSDGPDEQVFRRVGIAQTIWAEELGYPIHEAAVKGSLLII